MRLISGVVLAVVAVAVAGGARGASGVEAVVVKLRPVKGSEVTGVARFTPRGTDLVVDVRVTVPKKRRWEGLPVFTWSSRCVPRVASAKILDPLPYADPDGSTRRRSHAVWRDAAPGDLVRLLDGKHSIAVSTTEVPSGQTYFPIVACGNFPRRR